MALPQFTAKDVWLAARNEQWDELERIIESKPQLINESHGSVTSLYLIVVFYAPCDLVEVCLKFATSECVDYMDPVSRIMYHYNYYITTQNTTIQDLYTKHTIQVLLYINSYLISTIFNI
ncbi:uncharacterized protein LOC117117972 [Anneissia japonica]|uniref:uncharacterized protein LOC117117972 n=1 Tax=Anneissia japonica TaxID=1529436 RepID=UPI0014256789|nr:uncharacterized protein LOC117117972 [Anneissia japonica]